MNHNQDKLMHDFDENPEDFISQNLNFSISDTPQYSNVIGWNNSIPLNNLQKLDLSKQVIKSGEYRIPNHTPRQQSRLPPLRINSQKSDENSPLQSCKQQLGKNIIVPIQSFQEYQQDTTQTNKGANHTISFLSPINLFTNNDTFQHLLQRQEQVIHQTRPPQQIMVLYFIKRFLTKISASRRLKLFFKSKHFSLVGDKASQKQNTLSDMSYASLSTFSKLFHCKNKLFKKFTNLLRLYQENMIQVLAQIMNKIPLVYPQSLTKIIWDIILCMVLVYFFVMIPIEIAFNNQILFGLNGTLTMSFFVFLVLDYFIKMNTVYYEFGKAVTGRKEIFRRYLSNGFFIDGLALTTLIISMLNQYVFQTQILNLVLFLFFSQFHYFSKILNDTEDALILSKKSSSIIQLVKLILTLLFVEHFFSCVWYLIAAYKQDQNLDNWMRQAGIVDEPWIIQYLDSFYFSTVTMFSIGYGDIVPVNTLEKVVTIIFMTFACIQLSFSVNTVGDILRSFLSQSYETRLKLRVINQFMEKKKISFGLQYQIREYLKIYWEQEVSAVIEEENLIISTLSEKLQNKLIYEANYKILNECWLFRNHFSEDTKNKLLKVMNTMIINPENNVISKLNDQCICFIESGELDLYVNQSEALTTYTQGEYFGLEEFISDDKHSNIQLSSQKFVKLLLIAREDFIKILKENPKDYEEFCLIKDKYMLKTEIVYQNYVCSSCRCSGHSFTNCPLIHLISDKERIIKQHQWNHLQPRYSNKQFQRFRKEKSNFNTWADQMLVEVRYNSIYNFKETVNLIKGQYSEGLAQFYEATSKHSMKNEAFQFHRSSTHSISSRSNSPKLRFHKEMISSKTDNKNNIVKTNKQNAWERKDKLQLSNTTQVYLTSIVKQRFQNIVQKVIRQNNQKQIRQNEQIVNFDHLVQQTDSRSTKTQNLENEFLFYQDVPGDVINRLSLRDKDQFKFLMIKSRLLNSIANQEDFESIGSFETLKEFTQYFPQNNFSLVKKIQESSKMVIQLKDCHNKNPHLQMSYLRLKIMASSLNNYMFYPQDYISRFYHSKIELQEHLLQEEQKNKLFVGGSKTIEKFRTSLLNRRNATLFTRFRQ